jgi:large-conductance mechanosensitive channel
MQITLWNSSDCKTTTPKSYWWLVINNIVYFVFFLAIIFVHIKSCCSPDVEDVEEELKQEEKEDAKANTLK